MIEQIIGIFETILSLFLIYFFAPSFIISENKLVYLSDPKIQRIKKILSFLRIKTTKELHELSSVLEVGRVATQFTIINIKVYKRQLWAIAVFIVFEILKLLYLCFSFVVAYKNHL